MLFRSDQYISLHVRRGDYIGLEYILPTQDMQYYNRALEYFTDNIPVVVLSDDIEWCRSVFVGDRFTFSQGTPYDDMRIMIQSSGNIMSNSSYAWWGAFLSRNKNVVMPLNWFGKLAPFHTSEELLMDGWTIC